MPYDPERHHRQSIRLPGYDYSQAGAYFVTVCTHERRCLFGDVDNGCFQSNSLGQIAADVWNEIPSHFPTIAPDAFVVMPNHIHGILCIVSVDTAELGTACRAPTDKADVARRFGHPTPGSLPTVIGAYKSAVTRKINERLGLCGNVVWQRGFYERVIRCEKMLEALREYIMNNPMNWHRDTDYTDQ